MKVESSYYLAVSSGFYEVRDVHCLEFDNDVSLAPISAIIV